MPACRVLNSLFFKNVPSILDDISKELYDFIVSYISLDIGLDTRIESLTFIILGTDFVDIVNINETVSHVLSIYLNNHTTPLPSSNPY